MRCDSRVPASMTAPGCHSAGPGGRNVSGKVARQRRTLRTFTFTLSRPSTYISSGNTVRDQL